MPVDDAFWDKEIEILAKILFPRVHDAAMAGVRDGIAQLGAEVAIDWNLVNRKVQEYAEQYTYQLVRGITKTTRDLFREKFSEWFGSGKPLQDLIDELAPLFGELRAEMIAITEVTRLLAEGNILAWLESGVVAGKRWNTSVDELVCPICEPLNGMETALGANGFVVDGDLGLYAPPAHVRCRCWLSPVVKTGKTGAIIAENILIDLFNGIRDYEPQLEPAHG